MIGQTVILASLQLSIVYTEFQRYMTCVNLSVSLHDLPETSVVCQLFVRPCCVIYGIWSLPEWLTIVSLWVGNKGRYWQLLLQLLTMVSVTINSFCVYWVFTWTHGSLGQGVNRIGQVTRASHNLLFVCLQFISLSLCSLLEAQMWPVSCNLIWAPVVSDFMCTCSSISVV